MNKLTKKWGLIMEVLPIVAILLVVKVAVETFNLDIISISPIITAFVGSVIFIMAFIFAGKLPEYEESERIPGQLASSIKTLYRDVNVVCANDEKVAAEIQNHIKNLLHAINSNLRNGTWEKDEIRAEVDALDTAVVHLAQKSTAPPFLVKMRNEISNIDRLTNRIEAIKESNFIPAAYAVADSAIGMVIFVLLFAKIDPYFDGLVLLGAISSLLISFSLLIKHVSQPFKVGKRSYADVELDAMYDLRDHLEVKSTETKRKGLMT